MFEIVGKKLYFKEFTPESIQKEYDKSLFKAQVKTIIL